VNFDPLAVLRFCEFLYRPLQPSLLFRAIGDAEFNLLAAARQGIEHAARRRAAFRLARREVPFAEEIVRAGATQTDKEENENLGERWQSWAVSHAVAVPLFRLARSFSPCARRTSKCPGRRLQYSAGFLRRTSPA